MKAAPVYRALAELEPDLELLLVHIPNSTTTRRCPLSSSTSWSCHRPTSSLVIDPGHTRRRPRGRSWASSKSCSNTIHRSSSSPVTSTPRSQPRWPHPSSRSASHTSKRAFGLRRDHARGGEPPAHRPPQSDPVRPLARGGNQPSAGKHRPRSDPRRGEHDDRLCSPLPSWPRSHGAHGRTSVSSRDGYALVTLHRPASSMIRSCSTG
jgi:hypothetical protein